MDSAPGSMPALAAAGRRRAAADAVERKDRRELARDEPEVDSLEVETVIQARAEVARRRMHVMDFIIVAMRVFGSSVERNG